MLACDLITQQTNFPSITFLWVHKYQVGLQTHPPTLENNVEKYQKAKS